MDENKSILLKKSFACAVSIISLYKQLVDDKREYVISKQLLRSGTSVGANIREARNAESKGDFIHKLSITQKECDESLYWLELLNEAKYISTADFTTYTTKVCELLRIIKSSILTAKQNLSKNKNR